LTERSRKPRKLSGHKIKKKRKYSSPGAKKITYKKRNLINSYSSTNKKISHTSGRIKSEKKFKTASKSSLANFGKRRHTEGNLSEGVKEKKNKEHYSTVINPKVKPEKIKKFEKKIMKLNKSGTLRNLDDNYNLIEALKYST